MPGTVRWVPVRTYTIMPVHTYTLVHVMPVMAVHTYNKVAASTYSLSGTLTIISNNKNDLTQTVTYTHKDTYTHKHMVFMSTDTVLVEKGKLTIIRTRYTHIQSCTLTIIWHKHNNKTTTHTHNDTMTQAHTHTHNTQWHKHTHIHMVFTSKERSTPHICQFLCLNNFQSRVRKFAEKNVLTTKHMHTRAHTHTHTNTHAHAHAHAYF